MKLRPDNAEAKEESEGQIEDLASAATTKSRGALSIANSFGTQSIHFHKTRLVRRHGAKPVGSSGLFCWHYTPEISLSSLLGKSSTLRL